MKLKFKKNIAREFLTIILILIISVLLGLCFILYDVHLDSKIPSIESEITAKKKKADTLASKYENKLIIQESFFKSVASEFDVTDSYYSTSDKFWKTLDETYRADSIRYKYNETYGALFVQFLKSKGYNNSKLYEDFVGNNLLNKTESINYQEVKKINTSISELETKVKHIQTSKIDFIELSLAICIMLLIVMYPIRFLILAIIWSIKTMKLEE